MQSKACLTMTIILLYEIDTFVKYATLREVPNICVLHIDY